MTHPQAFVKPFDPVHHARGGSARQVCDAADVCRQNHIRFCRLEVRKLAIAQRIGKLGLQDRVSSGRAAAHLAFAERHDHGAERRQQSFDNAPNLLSVLQRARRMKDDPVAGSGGKSGSQLGGKCWQEFGHILASFR